jgi:hypothetical protein
VQLKVLGVYAYEAETVVEAGALVGVNRTVIASPGLIASVSTKSEQVVFEPEIVQDTPVVVCVLPEAFLIKDAVQEPPPPGATATFA